MVKNSQEFDTQPSQLKSLPNQNKQQQKKHNSYGNEYFLSFVSAWLAVVQGLMEE